MARPESNDAGYSPSLSIELNLAGEIFNVAALGGDTVRLRDARLTPAGEGVIKMVVNGNPTEYTVFLPEGVDPSKDEQVCSVVTSNILVTI